MNYTTDNQTGRQAPVTATRYLYFVSIQYFADDQGSLGFGNFEYALMAPITGLDGIRSIEKDMRANGYRLALILGYTLFGKEQIRTGGGAR
jgi:hypothetical protein